MPKEQATVWISVTPELFSFEEPGDTIEGTIMHRDTFVLNGDNVPRYTLKTSEGIKSFLAGSKVSNALAPYAVGTAVYVSYLGDIKTSSGRTMKDYQIMVAEGSRVVADDTGEILDVIGE